MSKNKMSHSKKSSGRHARALEGLSDAEQRLAKQTFLLRNILFAIAVMCCLGVAVYVLQSIPLDTELPNSGRRRSLGDSAPFVLGVPPVVLILIWWAGRNHPKQERSTPVRRYVLPFVFPVAAVVGQVIMAKELLVAGGALPG